MADSGIGKLGFSSIPVWLSDAICKAATGDGMVKRKLYSDGDLTVLAYRRIIVLTSIDAGALRGDLGERLLLADLEPIPENERQTEQEIEARFAERRPRLLGALLDALARVLKKLPDVRPERLPRMADFGQVLAAADTAGVTTGGLEKFRQQQGRIAAEVLDSDPFGTAVVEFVRAKGMWRGTVTELLTGLLGDENKKLPSGWPHPNGVAGRLKRLIPALASEGIGVEIPKRRTNRGRLIKLENRPDCPSRSSPNSNCPENPSETGDD